MKTLTAVLAFCVGVIVGGTGAMAQTPTCKAYSEAIFNEFYADFGESPVFSGLTAQGDMLYMLVNPETGSFTLLATDGMIVCLIGSGENAKTPRALVPNSKAS
jgi:hypothetical protein